MPPDEIRDIVRQVYPLVVNRHDSRVQLLAVAHQLLTDFAESTDKGEEWPDMALRVMLEYEPIVSLAKSDPWRRAA